MNIKKIKLIDASTLDKKGYDNLIKSRNSDEKIIFVGNTKDLPPISNENVLKDLEKF